jgi:hypothetical protein
MARLTANALADALRASRPRKPGDAWEQWLTDMGVIAALVCKDWRAFDRFSDRAGIVRLRPPKKKKKRA